MIFFRLPRQQAASMYEKNAVTAVVNDINFTQGGVL